MVEFDISADHLQKLKNGKSVTISRFGNPLWEYISSRVTFAPYKPGNLKVGDLVIVQLDQKTGIDPETRKDIDIDGTYGDMSNVFEDFCVVEIRENTDGKVFYVFFQQTTWPSLLYPFTEDMIYSKAIDQDLIFSWWELHHKARFYRYIASTDYPTLNGEIADLSRLEIQYHLLSTSKKPFDRVIWEFSVSKEIYPNPVDFWLECLSYLESTGLERFYFHPEVFDSFCTPFTRDGFALLFKDWFDEVAEIPAEIEQVKHYKRAMYVGYYHVVQSFIVETEEKWIGIFREPQ